MYICRLKVLGQNLKAAYCVMSVLRCAASECGEIFCKLLFEQKPCEHRRVEGIQR